MSLHSHPSDYSWVFEHDPCQYDTSMPDSSFVKYMREQDEVFYATFPDARRAAEEKNRLKALFLNHQTTYGESDIPLHFDYQVPNPMLNHATPGFQPHSELAHVWQSSPSFFELTSCSAPLNSPLSPTEATPWSAFPGQISGPSAAPQSNLPPPPSPPQSSPIHRPTHPAPTNQPPPAKVAQDTNHRKPPRHRPTSPSPAGRHRTGPSQTTKPVNPVGLTWSSRKTRTSTASATMRISPLPTNKRQIEKKPPLACLFCRGRKIACGAPLPGSPDKTCNQCQRRSLQCEYPAESRRGMRKKKVAKGNEHGRDESLALPGESILNP